MKDNYWLRNSYEQCHQELCYLSVVKNFTHNFSDIVSIYLLINSLSSK